MNALFFIFWAIFGTSEGKRSSISAMVSQRLGLPTTKMRQFFFYFLALYHVHQIKQHSLIYKFFYFLRNLIGFFTFFKTNFRLGIKISRQKMQI